DGKYLMDTALLKEVLETFDEYINKAYIGVLKEKFENLKDIISERKCFKEFLIMKLLKDDVH
ncbi:MAG: hypothetical protein ACK4G1_06395, partial [Ignavibacteria bacterium]